MGVAEINWLVQPAQVGSNWHLCAYGRGEQHILCDHRHRNAEDARQCKVARKAAAELTGQTREPLPRVPDCERADGVICVRRDNKDTISLEICDEHDVTLRHTIVLSAAMTKQLIIDLQQCLHGVQRLF